MISNKLVLLQNLPNVVSMSQSTVDSYKIDDESIQQFYDSVKLFSVRAKNDITYKYVDFHLKNNFKFIDIVNIKKYPLLAVYNKNTKRVLINISGTLKNKVGNISARDSYSMIVYGHTCASLTTNTITEYEPFCNYMCMMFLKIFSKKYGITGSFSDLIPQFKFIVYLYTLTKFFTINTKDAIKIASANTGFDPDKLQIPTLNGYDLYNPKDMIRLLSETGTCPGLNLYKFVETMLRLFPSYGPMNLVIFEDIMRFCCALFTSTINSNSFFPIDLQVRYSIQDYNKINNIIESILSK